MTPMLTHGGNITVNPLGVPSTCLCMYSAPGTEGLAKNVHQKYTLGVHKRNHAEAPERIRDC
jgi:hypothetical protein